LWRRAGIDAFMTKPVNVHELQYKLAKLQADLLRATSGVERILTGTLNFDILSVGKLSTGPIWPTSRTQFLEGGGKRVVPKADGWIFPCRSVKVVHCRRPGTGATWGDVDQRRLPFAQPASWSTA
jgi:hypothetical protein